MEEKAKEYKLSGIERVKKVHITPHAFSVQNDIVTPTFKLKRFNAKKFFLEHIEEMYSEGIWNFITLVIWLTLKHFILLSI